jgi:hypothetical protein
MAVNLSPFGGVGAQFFDNAGNVLTGGKIYTYAAGTTANQATYTTSAGNVFHANPIILDASGRVPSGGEIWLSSGLQYKFVLETSNNVLIGTYDNILGINDTSFTDIVNFTGNGSQLSFTLPDTPISENFINVYINGVYQFKDTFSVASGTPTLLFSEAPPFNSKIEVAY